MPLGGQVALSDTQPKGQTTERHANETRRHRSPHGKRSVPHGGKLRLTALARQSIVRIINLKTDVQGNTYE
jgi:hypothetical protein